MRGNVLKFCERRRILKGTLLFNSTFRKRRLVFKTVFIVVKLLEVDFLFPAIIYIRFSESRIIYSLISLVSISIDRLLKVYIYRTRSEKPPLRFMTRASAKLDISRVSGEGGHYVASFLIYKRVTRKL